MSAAERQRRRRQRQRAGDIVVTIVVGRKSREVFNEARWLGDWDEDNPEAVREAVQMLIDGLQPVTRNGSGK